MRTNSARSLRLRLGVVVLATSLLAACSSAASEESSSSGEPVDGGILRIGSTNDIVPANTFTNPNDSVNDLIGAVYDSVIDYGLDDLEVKPSLATSWKLSDDGTQLALDLREDVTFHTGRPFTSKDVEFSIKTWADPKWSVQLRRTAAAVTGFDTSDDHRIVLTFDHPLSNIFDLLDLMPVVDSETIDDLAAGKRWVGTGPFRFVSWQPNAKHTYERNDAYWGERPHLDGIEVSVISDPQAQVAQLRSGQLDLVTGASNRDAETLSKQAGFDLHSFTSGAERQVYVGANVQNPDLADVELRKAIAFALDRERILSEVYRGAGKAVNLPWPEYSPAYSEEGNQTYPYDVDRAKALVAGLDEVPTVPFEYPAGNANYEAAAQIIQANLEAVGITVELKPWEHSQFIKKLIGADFAGLWILEHSYAQYTPSTLAVSAYPFNAEKNASKFVSADYKRDSDAAWKLAHGDDAAAEDYYDKINAHWLDNLFLIEIAILHPHFVSTDKVQGVTSSKRWELDPRRVYLEK